MCCTKQRDVQKGAFPLFLQKYCLLVLKRAILWIWSKPFQSDGEAQQMSDKDYGYFGKGSTGYAQYKTSFDRNFDGPDKQPSGCSGCGFWVNLVFVVVAVLLTLGLVLSGAITLIMNIFNMFW